MSVTMATKEIKSERNVLTGQMTAEDLSEFSGVERMKFFLKEEEAEANIYSIRSTSVSKLLTIS